MKIRAKAFAAFALLAAMILTAVPFSFYASADSTVYSISIGGFTVPSAGELAVPFTEGGAYPVNPEQYEINEEETLWIDESGFTINNPDYRFDSGHVYGILLTLETVGGRVFSPSSLPTLADEAAGRYTVKSVSVNGSKAVYKITFTVPGQKEYTDIYKITMSGLATPVESAVRDYNEPEAAFNNFFILSTAWSGNFAAGNKFIAGETYTYSVLLQAMDGYSFASQDEIYARLDGKMPDGVRVYKQGGTSYADVTFKYSVPRKGMISMIRSESPTPYAGEKPRSEPVSSLYVDQKNVYKIAGTNLTWKTNDRDYTQDGRFKFGVGYKTDVTFNIRQPDIYSFTEDVELYLANPAECSAELVKYSASSVTFTITIRAVFRPDSGHSETRPIECYSFEDLKGALENPAYRYVRLNEIEYDYVYSPALNEMLYHYDNFVSKDSEGITVTGKKMLEVNGEACFASGYQETPETLIRVSSGAELNISGTGKIEFMSPIGKNGCIIFNAGKTTVGGNVVMECFSRFSKDKYNSCTIYQNSYADAELVINEGLFHTINVADTQDPHAAVIVENGSVTINGGRFDYDENTVNIRNNLCGGLKLGKNVKSASINAGVYSGIILPQGKTIGDYTPSGTLILHDGQPVANTVNELLQTGETEIAQYTDSIQCHINNPRAGSKPSHEVYFTIGEGIAESVVWYDISGQKYMGDDDVFEAGKYYSADITLAAAPGHRFRTDARGDFKTAVKLNGYTAGRYSVAGRSKNEAMLIKYTSVQCPYTVNEIDLELLMPKAGKTPTQNATCPDSANYYVYSIDWYDNTMNGKYMNADEKFIQGHIYTADIWVKAKSGYKFDDISEITATVNSVPGKVVVAYEQSPDEVVSILFVFDCTNQFIYTAYSFITTRVRAICLPAR